MLLIYLLFFCLLNLQIFGLIHPSIHPSTPTASPDTRDERGKMQRIDLTLPSTETRAHKSRLRKSSKKKTQKKTLSHMPYEELTIAKDRQLKAGNKDLAIKYIEQMMKLCNDVQILGELLLELSDLFFDLGNFQKSAMIYTEFTNLYPGNDKAEYALYRAILSTYYCTLETDRDQTQTEETVELADTFLEQTQFKQYHDEVRTIREQCYNKLAESEFNICSFYLNKGSYKAVDRRLQDLRDQWLQKLPDLEPHIIAFEADVAEKQQLTTLAAQKRKELADTFPHVSNQIAQEKPKTSMANRF